MKQQKKLIVVIYFPVKDLVRGELGSWMNAFDSENRGNRLSKELIAGLGGHFEDFIVQFILKNYKKEI